MEAVTQKQTPGVIVPGEIRTYTGVVINILDPRPEQILIEDIAHALAHLCRFGGHTAKFYSVAEHSIRCSQTIEPEWQLAALLHDATEAYLIDLPSPVKALWPDYRAIEGKLMGVIARKFGFQCPLPEAVKETDRAWLKLEWQNLMLEDNWGTLDPADAKALFLEIFDNITGPCSSLDKEAHGHKIYHHANND